MSKTLLEIAQQLNTPKKVQLIYGFNGMGKTRLSREFKQLIAPKINKGEGDDEAEQSELSHKKILYYNAYTEDLFYWDNDSGENGKPKLKIKPNSYTDWLLKDLGQDSNIVKHFQHYVGKQLTPYFEANFTEVTFSIRHDNNELSSRIKLSKGEESSFIWSLFYTLLDQAISILNVADPDMREIRGFDQLEYVFIDDPVSSLDDNHLIELAVNLAELIRDSKSDLKFIITTHSPIFYNVLFNELNSKACYMLECLEDGTFELTEKRGNSNRSFSYHLHIKQIIEKAIDDNNLERYHFTLLRNLYEKTASFLGYPKWSELLPDDKQLYLKRIINFTSHSALSGEAVAEPTPAEKATIKYLLNHLKNNYKFYHKKQKNGQKEQKDD